MINNKYGFIFTSEQQIPSDIVTYLETNKFEEWFNNLSYYYLIIADRFNDYVIDFFHIDSNIYEIKLFKYPKQSEIRSN